ncbi:Set domain protein, putative isoform 4 [Hibiscus syriacus]|uniref:Set domain protein, putative isoform 4 n=1 Tax=Hibiscus syriacus TaxID=106335 RepID=A0A6A3BIJ9_HIBSY|nr:Set domain protein, putative isoform 4 [Hibiscus syriacus]
MQAARRVMLEEIITTMISEFVAAKKSDRHLMVESCNQDVKGSDRKLSGFYTSGSFDHGKETENVKATTLFSWKELMAHDIDCSPGYELATVSVDNHAEEMHISSSAVQETLSKQNSPLHNNGLYGGIQCILEGVENELHFSAMVFMADYVDNLVKSEAKIVIDLENDENLNENPNKEDTDKSVNLSIDEELKELQKLQDTVGSSDQCHISSDLDTSDGCEDKKNVSNKMTDLSANLNSLEPQKPVCQSISENDYTKRDGTFMAGGFKRLFGKVADVSNEQEVDEPSPPGLEVNTGILVPSHICKFRSSATVQCGPKIGEYVAMAICRLKLHDDVLREWKSSFASNASFYQFIVSWRSLKKQSEADGKEEKKFCKDKKNLAGFSAPRDKPREGSSKSISSGSSEVSLATGTCIYYRKKKLVHKKVGPSQFMIINGSHDQPVERPLKKESSKNLLDHADPKLTDAPSKKVGTNKSMSQSSNISGSSKVIAKKSLHNDHSSPKSASGLKKPKDASAVRKTKKSLLNDHSLPKNASCQKTAKDASAVQKTKKGLLNDHSLPKNATCQKTSKHASTVQKNLVGDGAVKVRGETASAFQNCDENIVGRSNHTVGSEGELTKDSSKKTLKANKVSGVKRKQLNNDEQPSPSIKLQKVASGGSKCSSSRGVTDQKTRKIRSRTTNSCPRSDGCARTSINGWEWHKWSLNASPAERARVRGIQCINMKYSGPEVAAAEGADLLKVTQLKARKKRLRFQRSKIHN